MEPFSGWRTLWRYVAGLVLCAVLGWFAFAKAEPVPLLSLVDLGFHELGHLLTYVLPPVITAAMGSITQVLVPLGLATYFLLRRDRLGGGACLAWAATSAQNASVHVADAPFQRLHLIGGQHDWAFVLGPRHLNMLDKAHVIAAIVHGAGLFMLLAGVAVCVSGAFVTLKHESMPGEQVHAPVDMSSWGTDDPRRRNANGELLPL